MIEAVRNALALPDLRRKIFFTLLILIVYRAAAHVPVPGVDRVALQEFLESGSEGSAIVQFLNLLSGGALANFSIMAMGVYPYITASIIIQLLTPLVPQLQELSKEGEQGRNRINLYTHWLTVPLALLQAYGQVIFIQSSVPGILTNFGFGISPLTTMAILITMATGTMIAVWLGELITEQGIGNGVSILIFGGIVAQMPSQIASFVSREEWGNLILFGLITTLTIAVIAFVQGNHWNSP